MLRRLLVYSLLAVVVYYGYETLYRASSTTAPELRHSAAPESTDSGPIGSAVERRRAEERAVQDASARSPEEQRRE